MSKFVKIIIIETLIIIAIGIFPYVMWGQDHSNEILLAFALSLLNGFVGYAIVINSITLNNTLFYRNIFGGILVRICFLIGVTMYLIRINAVSEIPFFILLMTFYVIHQWTEISSWLKILPLRKAVEN